MQKRNLAIFSLLLISVLLISGCQEAVGGIRGGSAKQQPYIIRESDSVLNAGACPYPVGQAVRVAERGSGSCYRIVGCRVKTTTNFFGDSVQITNKESSKEYVAQIYPESNQLFCQKFTQLSEYQVEDRDIGQGAMGGIPYPSSP